MQRTPGISAKQDSSHAGRAKLAATLAALVLGTPGVASVERDAGEPGAASRLAEPDESSRLSFELGVDVTTAYYFRGIVQEDDGLIAQPYAGANLDVHEWTDGSLSLGATAWNSVHSDSTPAGTDGDALEHWYELDLAVGPTLELGDVAISALYTWYTSPADSFNTVEEVSLAIIYDDADRPLLPGLPLAPHAALAVEVGSDGADGGDPGVYLELGVEPSFDFGDETVGGASLSLPVVVGLNADGYYEPDGSFFGYVDAGVALSVPLPFDRSWGDWKLDASVHALFLGAGPQGFNNDGDTEIYASLGLAVAF